MTEAEDVAGPLLEGSGLGRRQIQTLDEARRLARSRMGDESEVVLDNVAYSILTNLHPDRYLRGLRDLDL